MSDREATPRDERLARTFAGFTDLLEAGLQPSMTSVVQRDTNWREGEYDIVIESVGYGVLHEELKAAIEIAERHGGRVFLTPKGNTHRELAILFPVKDVPGPGEPSPEEVERREARRGQRGKVIVKESS